MVRSTVLVLASVFAFDAFAAGGGFHLEAANNDLTNTASLQRGAKYFVNYCLGCHSAKYVRYKRMADDLGISEDQLVANLMFTAERPQETMDIAMRPADSMQFFNKTPPDLSLIARSRGTEHIYTFLRTFYIDETAPTGVNNKVVANTSMPHVLWELQGLQKEIYTGHIDGAGNVAKVFEGFELAVPGLQTEDEYDKTVRDIVNFLEYVGEPVQLQRRSLGVKVIGFLAVFWLFAFLLKKEYWKDVH